MPFLSRKKMLSMRAQLEQAGIKITQLMKQLGGKEMNPTTIHPRFDEYRNEFADMDAQQNCSRYRWGGLPPNMYGWLIETMLYYRGSLVGFFKGGQLYILPYTMTQGINIYGLPNAVQPITYNGADAGGISSGFGEELQISNSGRYNENAGGVILYDRIPFFGQGQVPVSRFILNQNLIDVQADIMCRIENNMAAASLKLVFEFDDEKQANTFDKQIAKNLASGKPYVLRRKGIASDKDGTPYQTGITLETQQLIEAWQSVNSIRCGLTGIRNGGAFEKKERKITGELDGDAVQSDLIMDSGLEMRRLFLRQLIKQYPEQRSVLQNITVNLAEATERIREQEEGPEDNTEGVSAWAK